MKRISMLIPAVAGCVLVARRRARRAGRADFAKRVAAKPDGTPAKWIFDNVTAIRQNTERILELLEQQSPSRNIKGLALDVAPEAHGRQPRST